MNPSKQKEFVLNTFNLLAIGGNVMVLCNKTIFDSGSNKHTIKSYGEGEFELIGKHIQATESLKGICMWSSQSEPQVSKEDKRNLKIINFINGDEDMASFSYKMLLK